MACMQKSLYRKQRETRIERVKNRDLDKLSLDMIQCEKDGYGCHYGAWKAAQDRPVTIEKEIPDGWLVCQRCGRVFKPKTKRKQFYCDAMCQRAVQIEKYRAKALERQQAYRERKKAEADK